MAEVPFSVVAPADMVSILIPCVGMVEYTKLCVPNLLRYTREPYELISIDIGSLDGTSDYLAGLHAGLAGRARVEVLRTPTDLGIQDVCKETLHQAKGEFICLLNNDTIVTPHWPNALTALANASDVIGMVGPMSNYAAEPQLVEGVSCSSWTRSPTWVLDVAHVQVPEPFPFGVREVTAR